MCLAIWSKPGHFQYWAHINRAGLQSRGLQRIGHDLVTKLRQHTEQNKRCCRSDINPGLLTCRSPVRLWSWHLQVQETTPCPSSLFSLWPTQTCLCPFPSPCHQRCVGHNSPTGSWVPKTSQQNLSSPKWNAKSLPSQRWDFVSLLLSKSGRMSNCLSLAF